MPLKSIERHILLKEYTVYDLTGAIRAMSSVLLYRKIIWMCIHTPSCYAENIYNVVVPTVKEFLVFSIRCYPCPVMESHVAERVGMDTQVDIRETPDVTSPAPQHCNMWLGLLPLPQLAVYKDCEPLVA
jgi:hypothetical protein